MRHKKLIEYTEKELGPLTELPDKFDGVTVAMLNSEEGRLARIEQQELIDEVHARFARQKKGQE